MGRHRSPLCSRPALHDFPPPANLIAALVRRGLLAAKPKAAILSGGRTNRSWRARAPCGAARVLKLYAQTTGNPLFPNRPADEAQAMTLLGPSGLSPRLVAEGAGDATPWLLYDHVSGTVGTAAPDEVLPCLYAVHRYRPWAGLRVAPSGSGALAAQTHRMLDACAPEHADRLRTIAPRGSVSPYEPACLIHGDPVPANIVLRPDGPVLIDWQCPAQGDPAEDLAILLSPAMRHLYGGTLLEPAEEAACLAAYPDRAVAERYRRLAPWFHWRMAAYCAWQATRGRTDYGAAMGLECARL